MMFCERITEEFLSSSTWLCKSNGRGGKLEEVILSSLSSLSLSSLFKDFKSWSDSGILWFWHATKEYKKWFLKIIIIMNN